MLRRNGYITTAHGTMTGLYLAPTKYCYACANVLDTRAELCPYCGVRQPSLAVVAGGGARNKTAAALFAFFLGTFGLHKFYLGKKGWGMLYLALFWTGIPTIVSFVEGIRYVLKSHEEFAEDYG